MNTTAPSPPPADQTAKRSLRYKLPTFRVGFQKQMEALKAYAILSENGSKPVHYTRIAEVIKVHEANVSSMNPFFLEIGLVIKAHNGYLPSGAVLDYNRARSWNEETAPHKLAPLIRQTWFCQELTQRLQFRDLTESEALQALADLANATGEAKPQLRILLDFCEATKIIDRANGVLKLLPVSNGSAEIESSSAAAQPEPPPMPPPPPWAAVPPPSPVPAQPEPSRSMFAETGSYKSTGGQSAGSMNFDISINVNMTEMKEWTPERITAFFAGIAQVLAAKNQGG